MTPQEWLTFAIGVISITTAVGGGVKWLVKHYLNELKPNGGGSLKDTVNRLEKQHTELNQKIDKMFDTLLDHVSNHNN